jgi:hypothetical protein
LLQTSTALPQNGTTLLREGTAAPQTGTSLLQTGTGLPQKGTVPPQKVERLLQTVERLWQNRQRFAEAQNRKRAEVAFSSSCIDSPVESLRPQPFLVINRRSSGQMSDQSRNLVKQNPTLYIGLRSTMSPMLYPFARKCFFFFSLHRRLGCSQWPPEPRSQVKFRDLGARSVTLLPCARCNFRSQRVGSCRRQPASSRLRRKIFFRPRIREP